MRSSRIILSLENVDHSYDHPSELDNNNIANPQTGSKRSRCLFWISAGILISFLAIVTISYSRNAIFKRAKTKEELIAGIIEWQPSISIKDDSNYFRLYMDLAVNETADDPKHTKAMDAVRYKLFPWWDGGIDVYRGKPDTKGIVITTGENYFPMTIHCIKIIRYWGSKLPIVVYYLGKDELPAAAISLLNEMEGVEAVDLLTIFDSTILEINGWYAKPFAMLAAPFSEVLLLDADVVLTQPPEVFFNYKGYKESEAIFFKDRMLRIFSNDYKSWFKEIIPVPHSQKLVNSGMYRGNTDYEQESGMVIIKKNGPGYYGLLATCMLNGSQFRKQIGAKTHGEKETFWLGFEIAQVPYDFLDYQAGAVGKATVQKGSKETILCGHTAHFDPTGKLVWFNDGIVINKKDKVERNQLGEFLQIALKGKYPHDVCLRNISDLRSIPSEQLEHINNIKALWDPNPINNVKDQ